MRERDVLNKIKWDDNENPGDYTVGYKDFEDIKEIRYDDIKRVEDEFMIVDVDGKESNIPLHRIRVIKKKGEVVWQR